MGLSDRFEPQGVLGQFCRDLPIKAVACVASQSLLLSATLHGRYRWRRTQLQARPPSLRHRVGRPPYPQSRPSNRSPTEVVFLWGQLGNVISVSRSPVPTPALAYIERLEWPTDAIGRLSAVPHDLPCIPCCLMANVSSGAEFMRSSSCAHVHPCALTMVGIDVSLAGPDALLSTMPFPPPRLRGHTGASRC